MWMKLSILKNRIKARQANMRSREFEKLYEDSTMGNLKSPPIQELPKRSSVIKFEEPKNTSRRSLADQIQKYTDSSHEKSYHNLGSLNSSRSINDSSDPRSTNRNDKEIPDEGNFLIFINANLHTLGIARKPGMHSSRIKEFHGDRRTSKGRTGEIYFNGSRKVSFDDAPYKPRHVTAKTNRKIKDIAKEDFRYSDAKDNPKSNSDSKWNFWKTLKNPLQWIGLNNEENQAEFPSFSPTPQKKKKSQKGKNYGQDLDSLRNRSISHNVQNMTKFRFDRSNNEYPSKFYKEFRRDYND